MSNKKFTDVYLANRRISDSLGEARDCSVVAVAAVCSVSYEVAHAALAAHGRQDRQGLRIPQINRAVESLGFTVERVDLDERRAAYPGVHANLKSVTTHHPERFPAVWGTGAFLFYTPNHVAGIVNGENHDWTKGRAMRVTSAYRVTRDFTKEPAHG